MHPGRDWPHQVQKPQLHFDSWPPWQILVQAMRHYLRATMNGHQLQQTPVRSIATSNHHALLRKLRLLINEIIYFHRSRKQKSQDSVSAVLGNAFPS
jgi:hypothetical protein